MINTENLENLLVANWTLFVESSSLRQFVQNEVQKHLSDLIVIPLKRTPINTSSISLSRFSPSKSGYVVWIEFILNIDNKIAEGTIEGIVPYESSQIRLMGINGNLFF